MMMQPTTGYPAEIRMKLSGLCSKTLAVAIAVNAIPSPRMNHTRAPPAADHSPTQPITLASTSAITRFATSAMM
jgi:hypothetical protein